MVELDGAARRARQRHRIGGRDDLRLGDEQLGQPFAAPAAAQQIAIDLGERAGGAGDDHRGDDEAGDRAAGQAAAATSVAPSHSTSVIDPATSAMTIAVSVARSRMRRLATAKLLSTVVGEALRLAPFLGEGLDDLHRPQHLARGRADLGDAILAEHESLRTRRPSRLIGADHDRDHQQHHAGQLGRDGEQVEQSADAGEQYCAARPRRWCRRPARSAWCRRSGATRSRRAIFLEEARARGAADWSAPRGGCRRRRARPAS